jgi:dTDP-4-amino-4,6-dideoxygalactose transaminase
MPNIQLKHDTVPGTSSLQPMHARERDGQSAHDLHYSFGTLTITEKSRDLIQLALDKGRLSCGRYVREFERRFADLVGAKEAVAVSSGTDADALALAVLYDFGAQRGDEIILPALSFVATGNAVLQAGFKPVFVDIDRKTLCIDPARIEAAITDRTRAILPVHLMGKPARMDAICDIAKRHQLYVVGDAAEAHAAEYQGRDIATWGDMQAYSLYVAHITSTVEGGIVVTDQEDFAEILRSLRSHGRFCKCQKCVLNTIDGTCEKRFDGEKDRRFFFERVGFSTKMNELEAAIGLGNLDIYEEVLEKRRANLRFLLHAFTRFEPHLWTLIEEEHEQIGPHAMPIIVGEDAPFSRDQLLHYLSQHHIDPRDLFSSIPTQCPGYDYLGHRLGDFPQAEYIGNHGLHVGVHQDLTQAHLDYLLETIDQFIKTHG